MLRNAYGGGDIEFIRGPVPRSLVATHSTLVFTPEARLHHLPCRRCCRAACLAFHTCRPSNLKHGVNRCEYAGHLQDMPFITLPSRCTPIQLMSTSSSVALTIGCHLDPDPHHSRSRSTCPRTHPRGTRRCRDRSGSCPHHYSPPGMPCCRGGPAWPAPGPAVHTVHTICRARCGSAA